MKYQQPALKRCQSTQLRSEKNENMINNINANNINANTNKKIR